MLCNKSCWLIFYSHIPQRYNWQRGSHSHTSMKSLAVTLTENADLLRPMQAYLMWCHHCINFTLFSSIVCISMALLKVYFKILYRAYKAITHTHTWKQRKIPETHTHTHTHTHTQKEYGMMIHFCENIVNLLLLSGFYFLWRRNGSRMLVSNITI